MRDGKRGFTLVELSIVLVIVGLLIGGILVAQSMIATSKIVAVAAQIQQFDAGVDSFKSKYNYLPGDAPAFGGDGDGMIDIGPGYAQNYIASLDCEIADFWNNLEPGKFTKYTASPCAATGVQAISTGASPDVPPSKLGSKG